MSSIGYVVVEYNQASGAPDLVDELRHTEDSARLAAKGLAEETAGVGRGERYLIAEVVLLDDED